MNAQQLLDRLLELTELGVDLSSLTVVVPWEVYDGRDYHIGEKNPTSADPIDGELRLD